MSFLPLFLQAAPTPAAGAGAGGSMMTMLLPFVLIIGIMYFLMIRPQNKKQKELQNMLDSLKKGDKVITIGGIHGTVSNVKDDVVSIKVDENCKIDFNRSAIATVVNPKAAAESAAKPEKKSLFGKKEDKAAKVENTSDDKNSDKISE